MTNRPRRNSHRDANQGEIVEGLRLCGYWVFDVSAWFAFADLLVWGLDWRTQEKELRLFEVKTATGTLTPTERQFQEDHPGLVQTVRRLEDCLMSYGRV